MTIKISSPVEAEFAMVTALAMGYLPQHLVDNLTSRRQANPAFVENSVDFVEGVYANRHHEDMATEGCQIAAAVALLITNYNFHGLKTAEGRGFKIAEILRSETILSDEDPEVVRDFLPEEERNPPMQLVPVTQPVTEDPVEQPAAEDPEQSTTV